VTLSQRHLAALGAGLVGLVAAAVIAAVLLTQGGGGSKANRNGTAATNQGSPAPVEISGLAGVVPKPLLKNCHEAPTAAGAAATAQCTPPASGSAYFPDGLQISLYASSTALNAAYAALRKANDIGQNYGQCNGVQWGGEGGWAHGPDKPGGRRFCYFEGNVAVLVWTHEKLGQQTHIDLLATARSNGSDHSNLFNWYRFWHHRIGKCDVPNCVARV
jgi:hypothetical protein